MIARMNFCMLRFLKQLVWWAGFIIGCQSAFGFALIGPVPAGNSPDDYQVTEIGYNLGGGTFTGSAIISTVGGYAPQDSTLTTAPFLLEPSGDMGTPKSIGEGYRRNTPVMYYSFDASFLGFFGPDGAAEVDKAMAIYNSLTNVSSYSADLSEFPEESRRLNFRAGNASLLDIRSVTMGLMTEQLGFWEPVRWVWALHARDHIPGPGLPPCPGAMEYLIDKKNLDIVASSPSDYQYSSYVNGVLYSYFIAEGCTTTPAADAIEVPVDPLARPYSAVADFTSFYYSGLAPGEFYTSLTRDDVGALRYLIRQNNLAPETAGPRTIEFVTNSLTPVLVTNTLDLNLFAAQARTNDAATLATLYPGLIVTSSSNYFGLSIRTNITATLVSSPYDPAGTPPSHPFFTTNYSTNATTFFVHTFANVVTNMYSTRGLVASVNLSLSLSPTAPAGTLPTLVTTVKPAFVNGVFGDFFLVPTNLCGAQILSNLFTQVIATTNLPTQITTGGGTNGLAGGTNAAVAFTPGSVTFFTNHALVYLPVSCPVNPEGTFAGVEKVRFIRRDYDSLINQFWDPVTNDYTLLELTNSALMPRHMRRAVPKPDFLFTAADLALNTGLSYSNTVAGTTESLQLSGALNGPLGMFDVVRTINYNQSARPPNLAGPGTIESPLVLPTLMIYNKIGPLYENNNLGLSTNFFIGELDQNPFLNLSWGSFDGTTNAPEVYPNGTTIEELEGLLTGPAITISGLPTAIIGANYSAQLTAAGGQAPYTWTLAPGSAGLPDGLMLTPDGQISGSANGPAAIYDFTVRVTDSTGATKDLAFTITVS
jgi:hypothetical protein